MVNDVLVIGGGVAGITASLDLAEQGHRVYLVEREPSIGGKMAKLDKTFPTLDCSLCILAPKMVEVSRHPNIRLLSYSEVNEVKPKGRDEAFMVKVVRKPRFVREERCTGCQICVQKCPARVPNEFEEKLSLRKAIYVPFPQAVPAVSTIDRENCLFFTKNVCQVCKKFCPADAIDFGQKPQEVELEVASIIVATGFDLLNPQTLPQYGYKRFPNVMTSLEYERLTNAAGPTGGRIVRLSDGVEPKRIAFIQCIGSRNENVKPYCSQICCMYATKEAIVTKEHLPHVEITIFHDNLRATGKGHQEFMERASNEFNIRYVKGLPSEVQLDLKSNSLSLRYADLLGDDVKTLLVDMVVLCPAVIPFRGAGELAKTLGIETTEYNFFKAWNTLAPVDTNVPGIYVCGACESPKDISHSVAQASATALRATYRTEVLKAGKEVEFRERLVDGKPRVGVFVCNCGINIGSVVNVPRVVDYAKGLEDVAHAQEFLFSCSKDSTEKIKEAIREFNLSRVVVAACTPRTHEPLFRKTCEEAGLNPYLFEMVNIREHDSWVHPNQPEEATLKAMELVHMAVEKASRLQPLKRFEMDVTPSALVVGGGVSGLVAAKAIADKGFKVYLVEQEESLGGRRAEGYSIPFDAVDLDTLLNPLVKTVENHEKIEAFTSSRLKEVKGALGNFSVSVTQGNENRMLSVGVIINATGSVELKPYGQYGYGESDKVLTLSEFREAMKKTPFSAEETIVMILCAGSRENEGRTYCSSTCCAESLSLALRVKEEAPNSQVFVLFQDIRLPVEDEKHYRSARERGVVFVKYDPKKPPSVTCDGEAISVRVEDPLLKIILDLSADKVVLATPLIPRETNRELSSLLKVPLTTTGFFLEAHPKLRPLDFATDGIHLCGTCHSPQSIKECVYQALGAASRALIPLMKGFVSVEPLTAVVDELGCRGCGRCEEVCEFKAIELRETGMGTLVAHVNEVLCKGCGVCCVICPNKSITLKQFTDEQIEVMIEATLED